MRCERHAGSGLTDWLWCMQKISSWVSGRRVLAFSSSRFSMRSYLPHRLSLLPAPLLRSRVFLNLVCKFTRETSATLSWLHSFSLEICPSAHNELTQLLLQELEFLSTTGMGLANSVVRIFKTIRLTNLKPCLPTLILLVKDSLCCCLLSLE